MYDNDVLARFQKLKIAYEFLRATNPTEYVKTINAQSTQILSSVGSILAVFDELNAKKSKEKPSQDIMDL